MLVKQKTPAILLAIALIYLSLLLLIPAVAIPVSFLVDKDSELPWRVL